ALAAGLHFSGRFLRANFAVPAPIVAEVLDEVIRGKIRRPQPAQREAPINQGPDTRFGRNRFSYVIPLRITVEVGNPYADATPAHIADDGEIVTEAVPEEYRDREGYREDFLGDGASALLPGVQQVKNDVLNFDFDGRREQVLRYE